MPTPFATIFALGVIWGLAIVVADSKVSLPLRVWIVAKTGEEGWPIKFLECPMCQSFWYGLLAGLFVFRLGFAALAFAFLSYGFSWCVMTWGLKGNHHE